MARILVIDDDDELREMFSELLLRDGHDVVSMANGKGVASRHGDEPLDLVITDILMPEHDGLEAITELRRTAAPVKIIAISGGRFVGPSFYLQTAEALGADRTLEKPIDGTELLTAVHELLDG